MRENFKIAADESERSFGDDRLLIEKFKETNGRAGRAASKESWILFSGDS